jgi:cytochrome c oxidase subunit 2
MIGIIDLHNDIMVILVFVSIFVLWLLIWVIEDFGLSTRATYFDMSYTTHNSMLEFVWTWIPAIILVFIAVPSMVLLYSTEDVTQVQLYLKVIGRQWYWSYQYGGSNDISFDSYIEAVLNTVNIAY